MIKVEVVEVGCVPRKDYTFTVKSQMIDMDDYIPKLGKYVMLSFEEYEKLTGEKITIIKEAKGMKNEY